MKRILICLALAAIGSIPNASVVTLNAFNNSTTAQVTFDDGAGHSGSINTLLTQYNVTWSDGNVTFNTFSIDLFHTVTVSESYEVNTRSDLATAFTNGMRIAYILANFGLQDLTSDANQAAAVQIAVWDLSLNNHVPLNFGPDGGGSYSSGDPDFSVDFGSNPNAGTIAALVNQYLQNSIGATDQGGWLDASPAGTLPDRGQLLPGQFLGSEPVPEPPSIIVLLGCVARVFGRVAFRDKRRSIRGQD